MAYVFIQLTTAGSETGPFNLYSNSDGFMSAFETGVSKSSLLSGISVNVPIGTVMIRITSDNQICSNYIDLPVSGMFTSTTSTSTTETPTTTTTTTTELVIPFYYGVYNSPGGVVPIPNETNITILSGTLGGNPDGAIDIPFASAVDDFIWFAIPSSKPTKTAWFVTVLNQGSIGGAVSQFGNLFPDPVLKTEGGQEYKLYISNYRTSVTTIEIS